MHSRRVFSRLRATPSAEAVRLLGRIALGLLPSFALLAGCSASGTSSNASSGGTHAASTATAGDFCANYCDRVASCDSTTDQQTCTNSCTNNNAARFPKLRSDVVDLINQCLASKDCKTILSDGALDTCASEAVAAVAPSQAATDFCDAYASDTKKCSELDSDKAACLTRAKLYNDDALAEAIACTDKKCSDVEACVDAAFGGDGVGSSTGTGSGSGGSDGGAGATKDSGGSTSDDGGTSSGTCPAVSDTSACGQCVATSCCSEATACSSGSSCGDLVTCARACAQGDGTCLSTCANQYPAGISAYQALSACESGTCASSCGQ